MCERGGESDISLDLSERAEREGSLGTVQGSPLVCVSGRGDGTELTGWSSGFVCVGWV